jgi:hypothetical protein
VHELHQKRLLTAIAHALELLDGEPTQADPDVMGVACRAAASLTGRLGFQLKAKGQEKGDHQCNKCLAIVTPLNVGRLIVEIDGDGAVVSRRGDCCDPGVPLRASGLGSGCHTMRGTRCNLKTIVRVSRHYH